MYVIGGSVADGPTSIHMEPTDEKAQRPSSAKHIRDLGYQARTFDLALADLTPVQRRALRLLLTGASVQLVADAVGVDYYQLIRWLSDDRTYHVAINALQSDLHPAMRARLQNILVTELTAGDDELLDISTRSTLSIIRAIGRLDTETDFLSRSELRAERWSTGRP
jgi:hypothetical protein